MGEDALNLSVTVLSAKAVCSQWVTALPPSEPLTLPFLPAKGGERRRREKRSQSGGHARGLFDDRKAHAGLVAILFRDLAPAFFGLFTGLERAFDLGRAFHELVEVHRAELAANHPEIAALCHHGLLTYSAAWTLISESCFLNCAASVESCSAVVDEVPPVMVVDTRSK